ncbi:MAG: ROK family protein [Actinomycetes bacterium]
MSGQLVAIGIDLGGTHTRVAVVGPDGALRHERRTRTPAHSLTDLMATISDSVAAVRAEASASGDEVDAVGIGIAALVDPDGVARYAPNLPGVKDAPLRAALADDTGLRVVVDNDANVAAWGELVHGAARGTRNALVITLGTGIGGGIIIDGRVYRGAHGFAAEVGHWQYDPAGPACACGQAGHWEAHGSGTALGRLAREAARRGDAPSVLALADGDPDRVTGFAVGDAARAGAPDALALLDRYADHVAIGCAGLMQVLDPERIVVSGGLVALGDLLLDRIRDRIPLHLAGHAFRPAVPVVAAELGDAAGMVGAAVLTRHPS